MAVARFRPMTSTWVLATAAAVAGLLGACGEATEQGGSPSASVAIQPLLPAELVPGLFDLAVDRVRIRFIRLPAQLALDTVVLFPLDQRELSVRVKVPLAAGREQFDVTLELLSRETLLFFGNQRLELVEGGSTAPAFPLTFVGPGAAMTELQIEPRDTALRLHDRFTFKVAAAAVSGPLPLFYVAWLSSDPQLAPIDAGGTISAPDERATIMLRVVSPTGIRDSTLISFSPSAQTLVRVAGDLQSGLAGQALAQPIEVRALAADQLGVHGVRVRFRSLSNGSVSDSVVTTDTDGYARTTAVLGPAAGPQGFEATAAGLNAIGFSASAERGAAARIEVLGGNSQTDTVGHTLRTPLIVRVTDLVGNPVPDQTVTWVVLAGGGTLDRSASVTNLSGITFADYALGPIKGTNIVLATMTNPVVSVSFTLTAVPDRPASLTLTGGAGQSDTAAATLLPFVVTMVDRFGNLLEGKTVAWSEVQGGGLLQPATAVTGPDGRAASTYQLPTQAGAVNVVAEAVGFPVTAVIGATVLPASPFALPSALGDAQSGVAGATLTPLQVSVVDRFGNPVPGAEVQWDITAGTGSLSSASSLSDATGWASVTLTLGATPGPVSVRASIANGAFLEFSATILP